MKVQYAKLLVRMPRKLKTQLDDRAKELKISTTALVCELLEVGLFANFQLQLPDDLMEAVRHWGRVTLKRKGMDPVALDLNLPMSEMVVGGLELCKLAELLANRDDMLLISEGDLRDLLEGKRAELQEALDDNSAESAALLEPYRTGTTAH